MRLQLTKKSTYCPLRKLLNATKHYRKYQDQITDTHTYIGMWRIGEVCFVVMQQY